MQESWKKFPLLVWGTSDFPLAPPFARRFQETSELSGPELRQSYFCVPVDEGLRARVDELRTNGIGVAQIVLVIGEERAAELIPGAAWIELSHAETPDEFRARLFARIETHRQRRLGHELDRDPVPGEAGEEVSPDERAARLERAHFVHALALLQELPPDQHGRAIRAALHPSGPVPTTPWEANLPHELLLTEIAALALAHSGHAQKFREAFRDRTVLIAFRARNELKEQVEKILEPIWGGKPHAA